MVLKIPSKLALNAIDKWLGVLKVLSEKVLKLRPCDRSGAFVAALVLGLFEADGATKDCGGKGGTIHPCGT